MKWCQLINNECVECAPPKRQRYTADKMSLKDHIDSIIQAFDVQKYTHTRNSVSGAVTQLSPMIEHGLMASQDWVEHLKQQGTLAQSERFLMQVAWRDYFQQRWAESPERIWDDVGEYKTGWVASDYADSMPEDIRCAQTPSTLINQIIEQLLNTGWIHNHARLYLAAYVVHFRRIRWQVGARWMLSHLVDGNLGSNNFSWQWVASCGSNKPYIFNLENAQKFAGDVYNTSTEDNPELVGTYEMLSERLFPNLPAQGDRI